MGFNSGFKGLMQSGKKKLYRNCDEIYLWCILYFGRIAGVWIFMCRRSGSLKMEQGVSKRRHIEFRRWGFAQKKDYNIQNTAKVWNQEWIYLYLEKWAWRWL